MIPVSLALTDSRNDHSEILGETWEYFNPSKRRTGVVDRKSKLIQPQIFITPPPKLIISSDISKQHWGASCQNKSKRRLWSLEEKTLHINVLKLIATKLVSMKFTITGQDGISIQLQMENMANPHLLIQEGSIKLLAWTILGKTYMQKEYQRRLLSLSRSYFWSVFFCIRIRNNSVFGQFSFIAGFR